MVACGLLQEKARILHSWLYSDSFVQELDDAIFLGFSYIASKEKFVFLFFLIHKWYIVGIVNSSYLDHIILQIIQYSSKRIGLFQVKISSSNFLQNNLASHKFFKVTPAY